MGDVVLITRLINNDLQHLNSGRGSEPVPQQRFEQMNFAQKLNLHKITVARLEQRIDYLVELVAADESASGLERENVKILEADVRREIGKFEASIK